MSFRENELRLTRTGETFGGPNAVSETAASDLPLKDRLSQCRICNSKIIVKIAEVELRFGYALPIYELRSHRSVTPPSGIFSSTILPGLWARWQLDEA